MVKFEVVHIAAGRVGRAAGLLLALILPHLAAATTLVAPGDTLRIGVVEAPTIDREAPVDADGRIMLPLLGGVDVAGLDLDGVSTRIADALTAADIARTPNVIVEIAAYRPFYVGGAVAQPGAIAFSPGLTARHALILAGGLRESTAATPLSTVELVNLRAKWQANNYELLAIRSSIARLEAELGGAEAPDFRGLDTGTIDPGAVSQLFDLNSGLFADGAQERANTDAHYAAGVELADLEIDILALQADLAKEDQAIQEQQLEQARALLQRGLTPLARVQELERQTSYLSSDLLETRAYAARAEQNRETIRHQGETTAATRRIEVRKELTEAITERMRLEAESSVLAAALAEAGIGVLVESDTLAAPEPAITIFRKEAGATVGLPAGMDTVIEPGDVIEVTIVTAPRQG